MTDFANLSDDKLYRLMRRKIAERPEDEPARSSQIKELHALANEIRGRVERRNSAQTPSQ